MRHDGLYYDGEHARPVAVLWSLQAGQLHVDGEGVQRVDPVAAVRATTRLGQIRRVIHFPDGAQLHSDDNDAVDQLLPLRGLEAVVDRLERHAIVVASSVLTTLIAGVAFFLFALPMLAERVAHAIPPEVEQPLGDQVMKLLDFSGLQPTQLSESTQARYQALFDGFVTTLPQPVPLRLTFRQFDDDAPNAFAVPGGTIVFTDGLINAVENDEEFLAILAHEIGHQQSRHVLRSVLQQSAVIVIVAFITGDVSAATGVTIAIPTFLLNTHYSRDFEREADQFAFAQLRERGYSPEWFAVALSRIDRDYTGESKPRDAGRMLNYASSHPATAERLDAARTAAVGMQSLVQEFAARPAPIEVDAAWPELVQVHEADLAGCWAGTTSGESDWPYTYVVHLASGGSFSASYQGVDGTDSEDWRNSDQGLWSVRDGILAMHVRTSADEDEEPSASDQFNRYRIEGFDRQQVVYRHLEPDSTPVAETRVACD